MWLDRWERKMPKLIRRIQLQMLMNLTCRIFGQKRRGIWFYAPDKALEIYARYTRECMLNRCVEEDLSLQRRMEEKSYQMGALLRRWTGLSDHEDLARLVFLLYKNIGIQMSGQIPGDIYVSRCYFSDLYDPCMCAVISGMDHGIISGLYGGGRLQFQERITEGCAGCKACFVQDKEGNRCV